MKSPYRAAKVTAQMVVQMWRLGQMPPTVINIEGHNIRLGYDGVASLLAVGINQRILSIRTNSRKRS